MPKIQGIPFEQLSTLLTSSANNRAVLVSAGLNYDEIEELISTLQLVSNLVIPERHYQLINDSDFITFTNSLIANLKTLSQNINHPQRANWIQAIKTEMNKIKEHIGKSGLIPLIVKNNLKELYEKIENLDHISKVMNDSKKIEILLNTLESHRAKAEAAVTDIDTLDDEVRELYDNIKNVNTLFEQEK